MSGISIKSVAHLTSAHPRDDIRIFVKMCVSLSQVYDVSLVVADGLGDAVVGNVSIFDAGKTNGGRLSRMTQSVSRVYKKALELDVDVYHLHDPELIPIGLKLKKAGKLVIFDAHEDLPKQTLSKPYLGRFSAHVLSKMIAAYEKRVSPRFDCIIGATPSITDKFDGYGCYAININNYPLLGELTLPDGNIEKHREISYVGGISEIRGIYPLIEAMAFTSDIKLNLVGTFGDEALRLGVQSLSSYSKVQELGQLSRKCVAKILGRSCAAVVTFLNVPNHIDAQPNKMFEYMSAGLPMITSNFPLWRDIVEGSKCGICVDPADPVAIGKAMQFLVDNPDKAEAMGKNGRRAVEEKYNWEKEEQKLFALYRELLK